MLSPRKVQALATRNRAFAVVAPTLWNALSIYGLHGDFPVRTEDIFVQTILGPFNYIWLLQVLSFL